MFALGRRGRHQVNVWPSFVDALSSIVLVLVFMLLVFVLGQYLLSSTLAGRERALDQLNQQVSALADTLALERAKGTELRERLQATLGELAQRSQEAQAAAQRGETLSQQSQLLAQQVAALRKQITELSSALGVSESKAQAQQEKIAELGNRLNLALAAKAKELQRYRSEFFGRMRQVLAGQPGIRIVGDRFVFQSELLFPTGEAQLTPDGQKRLAELADQLKAVTAKIPDDLPWILRIDGHTDRRPIHTAEFASNWELSTARALSVVRFLIDRGLPPQHLAAAGFGEYYPLDPANTPEAWAKNRRIEIKFSTP